MKCNSDYYAGICPARKRNGDCVSQYPCRHKIEPPKPKTNADHIRSMTDAEFAMHIVNITRTCGQCPAFKSCEIKYPNFSVCMNEVVDWLKQPYGGDT